MDLYLFKKIRTDQKIKTDDSSDEKSSVKNFKSRLAANKTYLKWMS